MDAQDGYQAFASDYESPPWQRIRADVKRDLEEMRGAIENPRLDFAETQYKRGYIAALNELLARAQETLARALEVDPGQRLASTLLPDQEWPADD